MAHDFLGNELSIGDYVVFLNYNGTSSNLESGIITRVSEHTAEISGNRRAEYKIIKVNPVRPTMDNTWIPCSERLPETDGQYLVANKATGWIGVYNFSRVKNFPYFGPQGNAWWRLDDDWYPQSCNVTHWMPLPEPPEEEQNGRT